MSARVHAAVVALACVAVAACADSTTLGPYDSGVGIPDLGRACAYNDASAADFGPIPDFGTITAPNLDAAPPDYGPSTSELPNGCPSLFACLAPEGTTAGLTYTNFARPVFDAYCNRCHASTVTGPTRIAPTGYNWDDPGAIHAHLSEIRQVVGVSNFMPFDRPTDMSCDLRRGMVVWIDTGAP